MTRAPDHTIFVFPFVRTLQKELQVPLDIGKLQAWQALLATYAQELLSAGTVEQLDIQRLVYQAELLFLVKDDADSVQRLRKALVQFVQQSTQHFLATQLPKAAELETQVSTPPPVPTSPTPKSATAPSVPPSKGPSGSKAPKAGANTPPTSERTNQQLHYVHLPQAVPTSSVEEEAITSHTEAKDLNIYLTKDYYPIPLRRIPQIWKVLRQDYEQVPHISGAINVLATTRAWAKRGGYVPPIYEYHKVPAPRGLFILVDQGGSMVPFHSLSQSLVEGIPTGGANVQVCSFRNYPLKYLYPANPRLKALRLPELFHRQEVHKTMVLIISDAGAARGYYNEKRIAKTGRFLEQLRQFAGYIAWLNPMPFHRWASTSAETIAEQVDMFPIFDEYDRGFSLAVQTLLGKEVRGYRLQSLEP